jgi:hypothetical protein
MFKKRVKLEKIMRGSKMGLQSWLRGCKVYLKCSKYHEVHKYTCDLPNNYYVVQTRPV